MPEDNQFGPVGPFSDGLPEEKKPEEERTAIEPVSRWATFSGLIPGLILVVLSLLFFLSYYEILKGEWWQYFLVLLLLVFLVEYQVEYISPVEGRSRLKMGIIGLLLVSVGIVFLFNPSIWWPVLLLALGALFIIGFLIKIRRAAKPNETPLTFN